MNCRPAGVTAAAIVLGLGSLLIVLAAVGTVLAAVVGMSVAGARAAASVPAVLMVMALVYLVLAGWAIATVVGLFRMRPWARVSVLVIGALLAIVGLFSMLMCMAMPGLMANMPLPPNANPAAIRAVFVVMGLLFLIVFAIGLWWIVYFALRVTREAFTVGRVVYAAPAAPYPPPLPHAHSLEFYEAQPMVAAPVEPPPVYAQPVYGVAVAAPGPRRPASMTVLAVLLMLGAVSALPAVFVGHTQAVFFGFFVGGTAARVVFGLIFFWTLATALGLLALRRPAWWSAMAYCVYGTITVIVMMLPYGRARMAATFAAKYAESPFGAQTPVFNPFAPPLFGLLMVPALCLAIGLNLFFMVLLYRARYAFLRGDNGAQI